MIDRTPMSPISARFVEGEFPVNGRRPTGSGSARVEACYRSRNAAPPPEGYLLRSGGFEAVNAPAEASQSNGSTQNHRSRAPAPRCSCVRLPPRPTVLAESGVPAAAHSLQRAFRAAAALPARACCHGPSAQPHRLRPDSDRRTRAQTVVIRAEAEPQVGRPHRAQRCAPWWCARSRVWMRSARRRAPRPPRKLVTPLPATVATALPTQAAVDGLNAAPRPLLAAGPRAVSPWLPRSVSRGPRRFRGSRSRSRDSRRNDPRRQTRRQAPAPLPLAARAPTVLPRRRRSPPRRRRSSRLRVTRSTPRRPASLPRRSPRRGNRRPRRPRRPPRRKHRRRPSKADRTEKSANGAPPDDARKVLEDAIKDTANTL